MSNKSLVSVIMPAYNGEKYIGEAIESIISQTHQNWELIIVEDCSTDNTISVIESYLNDSRIRLIKNDRNLGISESRNIAIKESSGQYIAIQDDDDISFPERLEEEVIFLDNNPEIDAVAGHWLKTDESGKEVLNMLMAYKNPKYVKAHLLFQDCIGNGSSMYRKGFVQKNKMKYRENMLGMEDYCFWIEFSARGNISAIDRIVYKQRCHDYQESKKRRDNQQEKRENLFLELQIKALNQYGIELNEDEKTILKWMAGERTDASISACDYIKLFGTFQEIIRQANVLQLDFADEIAIACRKILGKKIGNSKSFWSK